MTAKIKTISYAELVNSLLANLPEREREVIQKRNALASFAKHTLEEIGEQYNITRERVRQIEREGLRKLLNLDYEKEKLPVNDIQALVSEYLQTHGGLMAENHLIEKMLTGQKAEEEKALNFILAYILAEKFERIGDLDNYQVIWKLEEVDLDKVINIATILKEIIVKNGEPLHLEDLIDQFEDNEYFEAVDKIPADNKAILEAWLRIRSDVDRNILGQWGLIDWNTIKPKRMTDKAYLVLLKEGKPLHFTEVADLINQANFDHKKACPATVHNELILDDKYVLIGRGIYALRDWGYQEGTVSDIIANILQTKGPLAKKDIMEEVLKQRLVQKTTVILALMNKDKFSRSEDGRYIPVK